MVSVRLPSQFASSVNWKKPSLIEQIVGSLATRYRTGDDLAPCLCHYKRNHSAICTLDNAGPLTGTEDRVAPQTESVGDPGAEAVRSTVGLRLQCSNAIMRAIISCGLIVKSGETRGLLAGLNLTEGRRFT